MTLERLDALRTVYLAGHDPKDPLASPVFARLYGLPRLYIQAGTHELLLSDIASFVDKARDGQESLSSSNYGRECFTGWQVFARDVPEGREAISHIGAYALDVLNR